MGKPGFREKNPNWRGGKHIAPNGYVKVYVGTAHHLADGKGYAYEHRLVAEEKLGRLLLPGEIVHHRLRPPEAPNPIVSCACGCGATFPFYDSSRRPRHFVSGHNVRRAA
jgi:hypothetical protein